MTGIDVGAVVAVFGVGDTSFAGDEDTGIVFGPGDAEIGIFFIVFEEDVELGLMLFDEVGFEG